MRDEYDIRESIKAKRLTLTVRPDGRVSVTKPKQVSMKVAEAFVVMNKAWIDAAKEKFRKQVARKAPEQIALQRPRKNSVAYKEARKAARLLVMERLTHLNQLYHFTYGTISIRDQKTRWGSCSANGNLSFNYRIIYLPEALQDYIIVHELCHTKEHNHSVRFWTEVARAVPNHTLLKKELRTKFR